MKVHSIAGANDLTLHVEESGNPEGKPMLFIHGFSQCRLSWAKQMNSDLARDFRLVAVDIRGHGLSDKPRNQYGDAALWAKDINAVIGTLRLSTHPGWMVLRRSDHLGLSRGVRGQRDRWNRLGGRRIASGCPARRRRLSRS